LQIWFANLRQDVFVSGVRKFYVGWEEIAYERDLLFIFAKQVIQTLNVAAGRSLQDLLIPHGHAPYGEPAGTQAKIFGSITTVQLP
jgi:hypothetical protein